LSFVKGEIKKNAKKLEKTEKFQTSRQTIHVKMA
jgi:hypothetical protein